MDTTPDMLPNKIYVNLKCAITLENKQLSIWEVVFMTKSLQTYYNLKSSISQGNTLNICLNIYLVIGIIIMVTIFFKSSSVLRKPRNGYIRRLMAIPFLPLETIAATFDSLKPEANTQPFTAVCQLHRGKLDSQHSLAPRDC